MLCKKWQEHCVHRLTNTCLFSSSPIKTSGAVMLSLLALFLFPMTFSFWNHLKSKGPYPTVREKALMSWEFAHNNTPWGLVFLLGMVVMECL